MKKFFSNFDLKIILIFTVTILAAIIFLIFQFSNRVDCGSVYFKFSSLDNTVGNKIDFEDMTPNITTKTSERIWSFGDGTSSKKTKKKIINHRFAKPGKYKVKLTLSGGCSFTKEITITSDDISKISIPRVIAPRTAMVGVPIIFDSRLDGARTWNWNFDDGNTESVDDISSSPVYTFKTFGTKKIRLIVNDRLKDAAYVTVYVKPRELNKVEMVEEKPYIPQEIQDLPPAPVEIDPLVDVLNRLGTAPPKKEKIKEEKPVEKEIPDISEDEFELLLVEVAKQSKTKEAFKEYMCDNLNIPVVKGDRSLITFSQLCTDIKGKEIKIKILRLQKNDKKCIQNLTIDYIYKSKGKIIPVNKWKKDK